MRTRKEWKREMKQKEKCRRRQEKQGFKKPKKRLKKIVIVCLLFAVVFFFLRSNLGYTREVHVVENKPIEPVKPKKSAAKKKKVNLKREKVLLAEHTIYNPSSQEDRNENMRLAAEIINGVNGSGYLLNPGEKFSWLEVVGDTTQEKGYLNATVIKYGKAVQDLGGGVCQVSAAINSAVQEAGIATHARKHSTSKKKPPAYIHEELGDREATVSFGSKIDFRFENTLENPIMFRVISKGGDVTVKVFEIRYQKI